MIRADVIAPTTPAEIAPTLRRIDGEIVMTVLLDGHPRRLALTSAQFGRLSGDLVALLAGLHSEET